MANHVDKIEVSISGLGEAIAIQGFEFVTKVNAIPEITIEALPVERADPGVKASTAKYSEVTALYKKLSEKARIFNTRATINIKITSSDPDEKPQEATLQDWILTDVGLSTVTTYVAPTLTLVFKHRIVELDRFGTIYEDVMNSQKLEDFYLNVKGDTVMHIMTSVYKCFANESPVKFFDIADISDRGMQGQYKSFCKKVRKQLDKFHPIEYIKPNGGLFLKKQLNADIKCLRSAIARLVSPHPFEVSTWNRIVNTICPVTLAQIVPKYYKPKLDLDPLAPWQECKFQLDSKKIEAVDVCSTDPSPVIGVLNKKTFDHNEMVCYDANRIEGPPNTSKPKCETFSGYIPQKVLSEPIEKLKGHLEYYAENTVAEAAIMVDYGMHRGGNKIDTHKNLEQPNNEAKSERDYAQTLFMTMYRKNCKASITSMPTFRDINDKQIHPGRVLIAEDKDTGLIFYGYIASMVIKGSTSGGGCSYYELTHVRPAEKNNCVYIEEKSEDTKNKCYDNYSYPVE